MKIFLTIITLQMLLINCQNARADETFQTFFNSCTYGVVTGALIGGASLALADDPGSSLAPISRGASLGLYAGALISVYKTWYVSRHTRIDLGKNDNSIDENYESKKKPDFMIFPQNQGLAVVLKWRM
jgi:hypothetical protein